MPVTPSTREAEIRRFAVQSQPRQKIETLSEKQLKAKRDGGMAQVVEPNKLKATNSNSSNSKKDIDKDYQ
jgi:hypothetical protein